MEPKSQQDLTYEKFRAGFSDRSDQQLVETFNGQVGNNGWTSSRASFLAALHDEFKCRDFDFSAIGGEDRLNLGQRIRLEKRKIVTEDGGPSTGPGIIRTRR